MSELKPEDVFTNIEPGETFHYLERESENLHARRALFDILIILLLSIIIIFLAFYIISKLNSDGYNYNLDLIYIIFGASMGGQRVRHLLRYNKAGKSSGLGVSATRLHFRHGNLYSLESNVALEKISEVKNPWSTSKDGLVQIELTNGEKIKFEYVEDRKRFVETLQTMIDNQRSNNPSETR